MLPNHTLTPNHLRLGGIAGIVGGLFLPAAIIQLPVTGWFPEDALMNGAMTEWLTSITAQGSIVLFGISLSVIAILAFMPFVLTFYKILPENTWQRTAGLASYLLGILLALASFVFAFGFTWGLTDLVHASAEGATDQLSAIATMGMRGFLAGDDLATCLIGIGNGLFALAALRAGILPKWLCWWGVIAAILVTIVLLRYFIPVLSFAMIGYPLVILWIVISGVFILRKGRNG